MFDYYKHYVRTDERGRVIYGFTNAFERPQPGDVLITDQGIRQYQKVLFNLQGIPLYKIADGQMVARTEEEIQADIDALPAPPKSEAEKLREQLAQTNADFMGFMDWYFSLHPEEA